MHDWIVRGAGLTQHCITIVERPGGNAGSSSQKIAESRGLYGRAVLGRSPKRAYQARDAGTGQKTDAHHTHIACLVVLIAIYGIQSSASRRGWHDVWSVLPDYCTRALARACTLLTAKRMAFGWIFRPFERRKRVLTVKVTHS